MAYGFATHLWVLGVPGLSKVKEWLVAAVPNVHAGDVEAWQLGDRLLVGAVNTSDRERRWRSIGVVNALSSVIKDVEWVSIEMQPDHGSWRIKKSSGAVLAWEPEAEEQDSDGEDDDQPPAELIEDAKTMVRQLVPLKLAELHHYVDWARQVEELRDGLPAPELGVPVQRLELDLPPAAPLPAPSVVARAAGAGLTKYWLAVACIVATAFTVSMVQSPGPSAFAPRLNHFLLQGASLWALGVVLAGWPGIRATLASAAAILLAGLIWSVLAI